MRGAPTGLAMPHWHGKRHQRLAPLSGNLDSCATPAVEFEDRHGDISDLSLTPAGLAVECDMVLQAAVAAPAARLRRGDHCRHGRARPPH